MFCAEYLIDLNATQAAIRAGYSKKTAYSMGQENLKKPELQEKIQNAMAERSKRTEINQDRVLEEIAEIAFEGKGGLEEWPGGKLADKLKALDMAGRHLGLFEKDLNIKIEDNSGPDLSKFSPDDLKVLLGIYAKYEQDKPK